MKTKVLLGIFTCILLISLICGINYIYHYNLERKQINQLTQNNYENPKETYTNEILEEETETESETIADESVENTEEELQMLPKYEKLYQENSDLVGWIKIDDTPIDYPVMQTKVEGDNDNPNFYINRDWDKKESSHGLIYVDADCELDGKNIIIYGHRKKDGTMFDSLKYYREKEYYEEHPIIHFDTLYEEREYEIIGVCLAKVYYSGDSEEAIIKEGKFVFYKYTQIKTEEEFQEYINYIKENSLYEIDTDVEYSDEIITLCSCNYHTKDGRILVIAKRKKKCLKSV